MAKFTLKAGGEIDVLTEDELQRQVDRLEHALADRTEETPMVRRAATEVTTDSSGNLSGGFGTGGAAAVIYQAPVGFVAFVHRLMVNAAGSTPSSPLTAGQIAICRNANILANVEYFLPVSGTVAPVLITEGSQSALWVNSGDQLVVGGSGLPVSTVFYFSLQVRVWRAGHQHHRTT